MLFVPVFAMLALVLALSALGQEGGGRFNRVWGGRYTPTSPNNTDSHTSCTSGIMRLLISASRGSSLTIDHCPPVENVASLVNGFLIHVVVSHRHLRVTVAQQISESW